MKLSTILIVIGLTLSVYSAPFSINIDVVNSKNQTHIVHMEGDEFSCVYESKDGYTLLRNSDNKCYYYAIKDGNSLKSSNVEIGCETSEIPSTLEKHLRNTSDEYYSEIEKRVQEDEEENHTQENWENIKNDEVIIKEEKGFFSKLMDWIISLFGGETEDTKLSAPPKEETTGQVIGLTIMVDFPIKGSTMTEAQKVHPNVTYDQIAELLNKPQLKDKYDISHSVRSFYRDISHNKLDITNSLINYVLLDHPRSYYDNENKNCGVCARLMMSDIVAKLKKQPNWKTEIVPMLQDLSYNKSNKKFRSLSILYAGSYPNVWNYGLWPHKSTCTCWPTITMKDGKTKVKFSTYQISPITSYPSISTFCHETGHMVCSFPDLYDYTQKTKGCGFFSLMASNNWAPIDPYLGEAAGWIKPKLLPQQGWVTLPADRSVVYKYQNEKDPKQYFLIENRQDTGTDRYMPGKGIIIWRCNRSGGNTSGGGNFCGKGNNKWRKNFELSIVQADGKYDLERNVNSGNDYDYWKEDNTNPTYKNEVSDTTVPDLVWKDNKASGLRLSKFSKNSTNMTMWVGSDSLLEPIQIITFGYNGKYDKKTHKIDIKVVNTLTNKLNITYCRTQDGTYKTTNPTYVKPGEYYTWFKCICNGYLSTNGYEKIVITN